MRNRHVYELHVRRGGVDEIRADTHRIAEVRIERVAGRKVDGAAPDRHADDGLVLLLVLRHHFGSRFVSLGVGLKT